MQLCPLASGSSGNCALVGCGRDRLLIDAGISLRRIKTELLELGLSIDDMQGVFFTHEHSDHVAAIPMLLKHTSLRFYAPRTVASRLVGMFPDIMDRLTVIHNGAEVEFDELRVSVFETSHDTPQSVGYRIEGDACVGICTDLGLVTDEVREGLSGVAAALIEANHDEEMLRYGPYPVHLKRRILSERGHLSNEDSGRLAAFLAENGARTLILGHLSRENNTPEKALETVEAVLAEHHAAPELLVAPQFGPLMVNTR